jgi:hypothetical protein
MDSTAMATGTLIMLLNSSIYGKPSCDKVLDVNVETKLGVEYSLQFYSLFGEFTDSKPWAAV